MLPKQSNFLMRQTSWLDFFHHKRMSVLSLTELALPHRILPMTVNLGQLHSGSLSGVLPVHCWIVTKPPLRGMTWKEDSLKDVPLLDYTPIWPLPLLKHIIKYGSMKFKFWTLFIVLHTELYETQRRNFFQVSIPSQEPPNFFFLIFGIHQYIWLFSSLCIGC